MKEERLMSLSAKPYPIIVSIRLFIVFFSAYNNEGSHQYMKFERTRNATRNIAFGVLLKCYQIIVPFLMRTVMIHLMGLQYAGLNGLFTSVLQVLNLAELGVGSAMVFSMYKPFAVDDKATICALMKLYRTYYRIIGLVVAVLGMILLPFIPDLCAKDVPEEINIFVLYGFYLFSTVLSYWLFAYKNSLLQATQRNDVSSKIAIAINSFQYVIQIIVLYLSRNYYYFVIVALLSQVISNITTAFVVSNIYPEYKPYGEVDRCIKEDITKKIKDLFFIKVGSVVVDSVDTLVISAFLGLNILAIYQNYFLVMNSVYGVVCIVFASITAGIGNSFVTETIEKNYSDFKVLTFIMSWIICVCCSCFIGLYQAFIKIWVGEKQLLGFGMVLLFCLYFYVREMAMIWATVKDAVGLWHKDRYRALIGAGVNLVLNISLVRMIGLYGILISTIVSVFFVSWPWLIHNVFKYVFNKKAKRYIVSIFLYFLTTLGICAVLSYVNYIIPDEGLLFVGIRLVISLLFPNIIMLFLYRNTEEYFISRQIVKKLFVRKVS